MNRRRSEEVDEAVLRLFAGGVHRTAAEAAKLAGVDEEDLRESLERLGAAGYRWDRHPERGIALGERSALLVHSEVTPHLGTKRVGRPIHFFRSVTSTNDILLKGAATVYGDGTVIVAEEQSAGRGRHGRRWEAPPFEALQFSVLFHPRWDAEGAALSTLTASLAVAAALREEAGIECGIRWPNDLILEGRKICGILSEYSGAKKALVIGVGLNVNQREEALPEGATSVAVGAGRSFSRGRLLASILHRMEERIDRMALEGFEPVRAEAERFSSLVGKRVILDVGGGEVRGVAAGIGPRGGLIVDTGRGPKEYRAGEVTKVLSWEAP